MNTDTILNELAKVGYDIRKTAQNLNVSQTKVQDAICRGRVAPATPPDDGPRHLLPYLIATKEAGAAWPKRFAETIRLARRRHNAGTHTLMSGTTGGWTRLYLTRLTDPVPPRKTFPQELL